MTTILNYTPHTLNIHTSNGVRDIPSDGVARVSVTRVECDSIDGITIHRGEYGEVTGLPAEEHGTWLVVSRMVAAALPDRLDLLVPGALVRDDAGRPIGCMGLEQP